MKKCFFKSFKNVYNYKQEEFFVLAVKLLSIRKKKMEKKIKAKNYSKTFCFDLGKKRSVYSFFNLSRWALKQRMSKGEVCGLKKISW